MTKEKAACIPKLRRTRAPEKSLTLQDGPGPLIPTQGLKEIAKAQREEANKGLLKSELSLRTTKRWPKSGLNLRSLTTCLSWFVGLQHLKARNMLFKTFKAEWTGR